MMGAGNAQIDKRSAFYEKFKAAETTEAIEKLME
jgi:hypothetical protein